MEKASWPKSCSNVTHQTCTGWWFHKSFSPRKFGEDEPYFDDHIFQRGWFNRSFFFWNHEGVLFLFFEMVGLIGLGRYGIPHFNFPPLWVEIPQKGSFTVPDFLIEIPRIERGWLFLDVR